MMMIDLLLLVLIKGISSRVSHLYHHIIQKKNTDSQSSNLNNSHVRCSGTLIKVNLYPPQNISIALLSPRPSPIDLKNKKSQRHRQTNSLISWPQRTLNQPKHRNQRITHRRPLISTMRMILLRPMRVRMPIVMLVITGVPRVSRVLAVM
jgi:hypothetical protein